MATTVASLFAATILAGCTANQGGVVDATFCEQFAEQQRAKADFDGSSTVYPVAEAWAEQFGDCVNLDIVVGLSGTGGGFKKFCAPGSDPLEVSDASRPIKDSERDQCEANGVNPFEIQVAIDGLAVVVSKDNTFVDYLSVSELNKIWTADTTKQVSTWKDLRADWPAEPIELYGPGTDSGTFDYFIEVIIHPFDGSSSKGRSDYTPSEDDNILVQGVASEDTTLGYFGLAYVQENKDKIRAVPIKQDTTDGGETINEDAEAVEPNAETVEGGQYKPLARPIFMYTNGKPTGSLKGFFELGLDEQGQALVEEVGYIKIPAAERAEILASLD